MVLVSSSGACVYKLKGQSWLFRLRGSYTLIYLTQYSHSFSETVKLLELDHVVSLFAGYSHLVMSSLKSTISPP